MKETKPEIAGVVLAKLRPTGSEIFADIGCGNGGVTEFFVPYVARVFAVDCDAEMVARCRKRVEKWDNVEVLNLDGREFLKNFEYDIVFFGGTKKIVEMLDIAAEKASRIAANAARMEIALEVYRKMKELGFSSEIVVVNISKSYELAGGTAFKSLNPVFVISGIKKFN